MARKNRERLNVTLTPELAEKLNIYIINVAKKHKRIPAGIKTKIIRAAIDEWLQHHENDLDIDWRTQ